MPVFFLAYLNNEAGRAELIEAHWEHIDETKDAKIITASNSIVEVSFIEIERKSQVLGQNTPLKIDALLKSPLVILIEGHPLIHYMARDLIREGLPGGLVLKPFDAIHLATAFWVHNNISHISEFHTYDPRLLRLTGKYGFPIVEPPDIRKP